MDSFAQAVQAMRNQAQARDAIAARVASRLAPIPNTSRACEYVTQAHTEAHRAKWEMIDTYRNQLVRNHRRHTLRRHAVVTAYWGEHTEAVRDTLLNLADSQAREQ